MTNAPAGGTVRALGGTYHGGVVISTPLTLHGSGNSILDASTSANGVGILVNASNSEVDHITVENATFEGILVRPPSPGSTVSNVRIDHDAVLNNDTGYAAQAEGECVANGEIPGDCGEGLHLWSATNSRVDHNDVSGNAGGILLADEFGPNTHNKASGNGFAGITIHEHAPSNLNDNVLDHNDLSNNNLTGDPDFNVSVTTDILIGSAATPITGTVISHNVLSDAQIGIWTHDAPSSLDHNVFSNVGTPVVSS